MNRRASRGRGGAAHDHRARACARRTPPLARRGRRLASGGGAGVENSQRCLESCRDESSLTPSCVTFLPDDSEILFLLEAWDYVSERTTGEGQGVPPWRWQLGAHGPSRMT